MANSQECLDLFRTAIEKVMANWTALKLAVEHGMAGQNSDIVASNFVIYIGDILLESKNLDREEVTDILEEVMDTQFQTLCEDNSPHEISGVLWKLFEYYKNGQMKELQEEINNLPVSSCQYSKPLGVVPVELQTITEKENTEQQCAQVPSAEPTCDEDMEMVEPGWTYVPRRRKNSIK